METHRASDTNLLFAVATLRSFVPTPPIVLPNQGREGLIGMRFPKVYERRVSPYTGYIRDLGHLATDLSALARVLGRLLRRHGSGGG